MKKILLIVLLLTAMQNYAQKTFEVYNYTGTTIQIFNIVTNPGGTSYPEYHSKPSGSIPVASGSSFTLYNAANVYRFPFNASPLIPTWHRLNSISSSVTLPASAAWIAGNSQVFKSMMFFVGSDPAYHEITASGGMTSGTGWTAIYDQFQDPNDPNIIIYTIVIF